MSVTRAERKRAGGRSRGWGRLAQTAIALGCAHFVIGGVGVVLVGRYIERHLTDQLVENIAFTADTVSQALEARLGQGEPHQRVAADLQMALTRSPNDPEHFLCLIDRDGKVLCHPDPAVVRSGMTVTGLETFGLNGAPAATYGDIVQAGRRGPWRLAQTGEGGGTELVYTRPISGPGWTLAVHQNNRAVADKVRRVRGHVIGYMAVVGLLVVGAGTGAVHALTRWYERRIEALNDDLEDTVAERTRELESALRELEEAHNRLLRGERTKLLGELMASIAHELNNPLTAVVGGSDGLAEELGGLDGPAARYLETLQAGAERCARIVSTMLDFARDGKGERFPTPLAQIVQRCVTLVAGQLRSAGIEPTVQIDPALTVCVDPQQIEQVVLNLLHNAAQALATAPPPRRIAVSGVGGRNRTVRLRITDNGPGIPPEARERVFDAFFTTKGMGQGTGLGLSLCKRFVEAHGGTIRLIDTEVGASFEIELPLPDRPSARWSDGLSAGASPEGGR